MVLFHPPFSPFPTLSCSRPLPLALAALRSQPPPPSLRNAGVSISLRRFFLWLSAVNPHPRVSLVFSTANPRKPGSILSPGKSSTPSHKGSQSRPARSRRLRCDCGKIAITVRLVRVGCDPQYTIRLPLCASCLQIELEMEGDLE